MSNRSFSAEQSRAEQCEVKPCDSKAVQSNEHQVMRSLPVIGMERSVQHNTQDILRLAHLTLALLPACVFIALYLFRCEANKLALKSPTTLSLMLLQLCWPVLTPHTISVQAHQGLHDSIRHSLAKSSLVCCPTVQLVPVLVPDHRNIPPTPACIKGVFSRHAGVSGTLQGSDVGKTSRDRWGLP